MKRLTLFLLFIWSSLVIAAGGIPTKYMNDAANDLVHKGQKLFPEEVHRLITDSKGKFDISTLNPIETSDLWKNVFVKELPVDQTPINEMDEVKYHSPVLSESGIFRFNIQNPTDGKMYTMLISPKVHTFLLSKSLLRKIGYQIPDIKYLPKVVLTFNDKAQKEGFLSYLYNVAEAGSTKRWIIEELGDDKLIVQDLIVMNSNHLIYNLTAGVSEGMPSGRRLISALAVPLSIVNLEESVNMFRWNVGRKEAGEIELFTNNLDLFQCTWDDARWISRRIEKLTRADWTEIVASSNTPKPVQQILVEKIISRRNDAMKLFKIDAQEMKVESNVSNGVELVKGKLTQINWPGYGSRFAHGDPESPLADSEMKSFIKSRVISTALDLAISQLNQLPFMGTDVAAMNTAKFQEIVKKATQEAQAKNVPVEIPVKPWVFPTFRGQIILSRNIVTGTFMGTDNLVNLVDTVGVSLSAGAFVGVAGLPTPVKAYASGEAQLVRTYAHLRPIKSITASLKYPFKNVLIPIVKKDYGRLLHDAYTVSIDENVDEETKVKKIEAALAPFKKTVEIGESILVTDAINTFVGGKVSVGLDKLLTASLGFVPSYRVVSRFHVHRRSEHEFQVYRDLGQEGTGGVTFDFDTLVPVLSVNLKASVGSAKVKFFSINTNPKNPDVLKNLSLLRKAIVNNSVKDMEEEERTKPFILRHNYKEKNPSVNLFFWQWRWNDASTKLTVTNPSGDQRYYRRHYLGQSKGKNYQAYLNAVISHWVDLLFDKKAGLSDGGENPGYSFKGSGETRYLTFDEEVTKEGMSLEPFARLSHIHNGWSINREKAMKILDSMKQKYRHDFFNAPVLNDTRRIFLYNISLNIFFYKAGIEHLIDLKGEQIRRIFRENMVLENLMINPDPEKVTDEQTGVEKFLKQLAEFKTYELKGDYDKANKALLKSLDEAEKRLNLNGMVQLMGGEENIHVNARIDGFREGDENGDNAILSNSIGEFGSRNRLGPIAEAQNMTGMLEGEFMIYWMMTRLI